MPETPRPQNGECEVCGEPHATAACRNAKAVERSGGKVRRVTYEKDEVIERS